MVDQSLPDHAALARQHGEHPFRQACLERQLAQIRIAVSGVASAGLATTVQPAARAGAMPQDRIGIGKFHGTIRPTTPTGSWKVTFSPPGTGICLPMSRSGAAE